MEKGSRRELVASVAGPFEYSDNRKSWLNRAARRSGLSYRTIKSVWYGEITDESHHSIRLLKHAANERTEVLARRLETIARGMEQTDPNFYRPDVSALIHAIRCLRSLDSSGDD